MGIHIGVLSENGQLSKLTLQPGVRLLLPEGEQLVRLRETELAAIGQSGNDLLLQDSTGAEYIVTDYAPLAVQADGEAPCLPSVEAASAAAGFSRHAAPGADFAPPIHRADTHPAAHAQPTLLVNSSISASIV